MPCTTAPQQKALAYCVQSHDVIPCALCTVKEYDKIKGTCNRLHINVPMFNRTGYTVLEIATF